MTLGSLFDGSGGFPLAASMCGITPVWASEIDPFCVSVTSKRFPHMKHLGDVKSINGGETEPVNIISFGSPCQDLSVAGKRTGLGGKRSGLFTEAVRIIKEMRAKTNGIYPDIIIWENVPGVFSSGGGEDFRTVLEEIARIADPTADVPRPAKGIWHSYGCVMGDSYSIAWRTLDAKYWGVPQRRKRIFLVADFRGERAAEILFKREGLQGDFAESRRAWKGASAAAQSRTGVSDHAAGFRGDTGAKARNIGYSENVSPTLQAGQYTHCLCYSFYPQMKAESQCFTENISVTLVNGTSPGCHNGVVLFENHPQEGRCKGPVDVAPTVMSAYGMGGNNTPLVMTERSVVRRLTPLECCRLQGFPDWWCEDIPHRDRGEYRMWGNGVALPCVLYVMEGVRDVLAKNLHR